MKKDHDTNKILNPPNYVILIFWFLILIFILFNIVISDTSNTQSNQKIEISIHICIIKNYRQVEVETFETNISPHICGKVLTEFLPLDLRYSLKNMESEEYVLFSKYKKIDAYEFSIQLPDNLDAGHYEFEIKSGRRHIATLSFEVAH